METSGGVDDQNIAGLALCLGVSALGDVHGIHLIAHGENRYLQLLAQHLQLLDGRGTVHVAGRQHRPPALLLKIAGQLGAGSGLAGALKAGHQDHRGPPAGVGDLGGIIAHQAGHLLVYDLDDLLSRGQALHDLSADGPFLYRRHKILYNFIIYVGFQKGHPHFPHRVIHVLLGKLALAS